MVSNNPISKVNPKNPHLTSAGFFISFLASLAMLYVSLTWQSTQKLEKQKVYFPPPLALTHFTFGYRETMADMFWLRAIQDMDYCEKKSEGINCAARGWLFRVMDLTTELSPTFVAAHSMGALALSVLVSDIEGASVIFDKAVARFPWSWKIAYHAGYHALIEEKNPAKAAGLLEQAARKGAPNWVYSLAARLYTDTGRKELAQSMVQSLESSGFDQKLIERMKQKISEAN